MFNVREGLHDDSLPDRLTKEEQIEGRPDTKVPLDEMLPKFYADRGWDSRGVPTTKTLKFLDLEFTADALPAGNKSLPELQAEFIQHRQAYEQEQAKVVAERMKFNQKR